MLLGPLGCSILRYFYLGEDFVVEVPSAIKFLVTTFFVVEAADGDMANATASIWQSC